jgi:hypothetical protein
MKYIWKYISGKEDSNIFCTKSLPKVFVFAFFSNETFYSVTQFAYECANKFFLFKICSCILSVPVNVSVFAV